MLELWAFVCVNMLLLFVTKRLPLSSGKEIPLNFFLCNTFSLWNTFPTSAWDSNAFAIHWTKYFRTSCRFGAYGCCWYWIIWNAFVAATGNCDAFGAHWTQNLRTTLWCGANSWRRSRTIGIAFPTTTWISNTLRYTTIYFRASFRAFHRSHFSYSSSLPFDKSARQKIKRIILSLLIKAR